MIFHLIAATLLFTPPKGWTSADDKQLKEKASPHVKAMCIGPRRSWFTPSMNLAIEPYEGTLQDFLKMVQAVNAAHGDKWQDLGALNTNVGKASLSQVDMANEWGTIRQLHLIFVQNGNAYVLSAAALKEDFSYYSKDFYKSLMSVKFSD